MRSTAQKLVLSLTFSAGLSIACSAPAQAELIYYGRKTQGSGEMAQRTEITADMGFKLVNFSFEAGTPGSAQSNINGGNFARHEVDWDNMMIFDFNTALRHFIPIHSGGLLLEAGADANMVFDGDASASEYTAANALYWQDDRESDGSGYGFSADVGYTFDFTNFEQYSQNRISQSITPLVGYGFSWQKYKMQYGQDVVDTLDLWSTEENGNVIANKVAHKSLWHGPFMGAEYELLMKRHRFLLRGEYHDLTYSADSNWSDWLTNLANEPSFEHDGDGNGYKFDLDYSYALDSHYAISLAGAYEARSVEDGTSTTHLTNGTRIVTPLDEVKESAMSLRIGLDYVW
jgi:hypothetical protein